MRGRQRGPGVTSMHDRVAQMALSFNQESATIPATDSCTMFYGASVDQDLALRGRRRLPLRVRRRFLAYWRISLGVWMYSRGDEKEQTAFFSNERGAAIALPQICRTLAGTRPRRPLTMMTTSRVAPIQSPLNLSRLEAFNRASPKDVGCMSFMFERLARRPRHR